MYEKMMSDYQNSEGSALNEALKTANSWEGLLNQISNNWTSFVGSFVTDGLATGALKTVNGLTKGIDSLVKSLGALPTVALAAFGFLAFKNIGRTNSCSLFKNNIIEYALLA